MRQGAILAALLVAAALADTATAPGLAFYLVLAAVLPGATVALSALGELVDARESPLPEALALWHALCTGLALLAVVACAAVRSPGVDLGTVPPLATSLVFCALGLLALGAVTQLATRPLYDVDTSRSL